MTVTDDGVNQVLIPSNTASYLEGLGLRYNDSLGRLATYTGDTRPLEQIEQINQIQTDVLVVLRIDKAAGGGGFAGLPQPFNYYKGVMIIVDKPDVIAAFADPGGYLATEYLNANFVPDVARQVGWARSSRSSDDSPPRLRAGGLCRISSALNDKRDRVDRQRADITVLAEVKGWDIADWYVDNNVSASNGKGRPEWQRLLADIKAGKIDGILAWDQDRN